MTKFLFIFFLVCCLNVNGQNNSSISNPILNRSNISIALAPQLSTFLSSNVGKTVSEPTIKISSDPIVISLSNNDKSIGNLPNLTIKNETKSDAKPQFKQAIKSENKINSNNQTKAELKAEPQGKTETNSSLQKPKNLAIKKQDNKNSKATDLQITAFQLKQQFQYAINKSLEQKRTIMQKQLKRFNYLVEKLTKQISNPTTKQILIPKYKEKVEKYKKLIALINSQQQNLISIEKLLKTDKDLLDKQQEILFNGSSADKKQ